MFSPDTEVIYDLFNLAICFSISHSITLTWKIKFKDEKFATIFNSVQCSFITLKNTSFLIESTQLVVFFFTRRIV